MYFCSLCIISAPLLSLGPVSDKLRLFVLYSDLQVMHSGSLLTLCRGQWAAVSGAGPRRAPTDEVPRQQEGFEIC